MTCQCLWHLHRPDSRLVHARNIDMSVFLLPMNYDYAQISPGKRTLFGCDHSSCAGGTLTYKFRPISVHASHVSVNASHECPMNTDMD